MVIRFVPNRPRTRASASPEWCLRLWNGVCGSEIIHRFDMVAFNMNMCVLLYILCVCSFAHMCFFICTSKKKNVSLQKVFTPYLHKSFIFTFTHLFYKNEFHTSTRTLSVFGTGRNEQSTRHCGQMSEDEYGCRGSDRPR